MKSVMQHQFSEVPRVEIQRSGFDRSHGFKCTFDAGYLVPCLVDEVLPGDTFNVQMNGFARISTPLYPIMDNLRMETFFFFVPYRLVWANFKKFMGERTNPTDNIDYTVPQIAVTNAANESIYDYLGVPTQVNAALNISALPLRAINLIYNEWFRDQNLQNSLTVSTADADDLQATYTMLRRGKRHDYFTSCLPWPQKGDEVLLSLGVSAPVKGIGKVNTVWGVGVNNVHESDETHASYHGAQYIDSSAADNQFAVEMGYDDVLDVHKDWPNIRADLSQAIGPSVNEFREAIQLQRMLEREARAGSRYTEIVKSFFGVDSPDGRLQRPEYLGGGSTPVHISPVANTSNTSTGKLGAMGVASFMGHGFNKSFTEHGVIIGFVNVRADLTYQEGLERFWSRETRYDFYWPTLAHLGEMAVLNKEIYVDAASIGDGSSEGIFGYQERFADYRYKPSRICGKFRSNDAASLDAWHLGIEFGAMPTLNAAFMEDNPPLDRVIAVPAEPHFIFDSYFQMRCARPMPVYSVPGLVDHF